jgi:hypothetical protein
VADDDVSERSLTAALAEFQALRGEIVQRIQLQELILGLAITAIGALFTIALTGKTSRSSLLLATPFVTSALGVAHAEQVHRLGLLGDYVRDHLWPRVAVFTIADLPSWERYFAASRRDHRVLHRALSVYIFTLFVLSPVGADLYAAAALHCRLTTAEWWFFGTGVATTLLCAGLTPAAQQSSLVRRLTSAVQKLIRRLRRLRSA